MLTPGFFVATIWSFTMTAGPVPRDVTTNKPTPEACAGARVTGRTLPGCEALGLNVGNQGQSQAVRRDGPPQQSPRSPR